MTTAPPMTTQTRLAGRKAIVTGGARGIGAAIARRLVDEGAEVVYSAKVTEIADGVAKIAITATCGDEAVLGAARAEVSVV